MILSSMFFFFFSSRRRHTRWPRDWSSDMCSSDLRSPLRSRWSGRTSPPPRAWFDGSARRPPPIPRRAGSCDGRTPTARAWPAGSWSWSRTNGWSSPTAGRTAGWACRPRAPPWRCRPRRTGRRDHRAPGAPRPASRDRAGSPAGMGLLPGRTACHLVARVSQRTAWSHAGSHAKVGCCRRRLGLSPVPGWARMSSRSGLVALTIRLLGPPAIERDSGPAPPPRGRKAWALLAYLLLADRPPGRRHLAELLFSDADDPLGALRWTLAELRRALGAPGLLGGDPVATTLGPGLDVDLHAVTVEPADPAPLLELGGELLEGISIAASPAFESWLVVERHRLAAAVEARLREAALSLLASGRAEAAVAYAARVVARNPLEEGNHELLVRSAAWPRPATGPRRSGRWRSARTPCAGSSASSRRRRCGTRRPPRPARRCACRSAAGPRSPASWRRAGRRSRPVPSRPASTASAGPARTRQRAPTPRCRARRWPPWAARWSTPSGVATRRARRSSTRPSGWPSWPVTGPPR